MNTSPAPLRRLLAVSLLLLSASACRPADPFEQKVDASTPAELSEWWAQARDDFNDEDAAEIDRAFATIEAATPRLHESAEENRNDPFCRRVNKLTVRRVLITGYEEKNSTLLQRISIETGHLQERLQNTPDDLTPAQVREQEAIIAGRKKYIEQMSAEVEKNKARIAELSNPKT